MSDSTPHTVAASTDLPQILSDDEFTRLLTERRQLPCAEQERWDNAGIRPGREPSDGRPECTIEQRFPRIAQKLAVVWPSEACALYISDLIVNKRETRQGFPKDVLEDLLMLHAINDMLLRSASATRRPAAKPAAPAHPQMLQRA